jgi:hypothetical protein
MRLHEDREAFLTLLNLIHDQTNVRLDILEKDYYVTLLLAELAHKQKNLPVYFKGGTALYKALKNIRRFSEDIDLTVCIEGCTNSQAKRRLELASKGYTCLQRTGNQALEEDRRGSITSVYEYEPAVSIDRLDSLQRFGRVKVESTSFTVSEPHASLIIEPVLYTRKSRSAANIDRCICCQAVCCRND